MSWLEALILGIVQGLTEYLPVSSSGHLAIGQYLFGVNGEEALDFTIVVHIATVLSTCLILWKEIVWLFKDLFKFKWNDGTKYIVNILISMIPVIIVGFFFKDKVEEVFGSGLLVVGICLLITAVLLAFSYFAKPRQKENISPVHAFVIGIAQAVAVLPGLSRSGATISTGLLLGDKQERLAQFSFLMVIPPILGEALLDIAKAFSSSPATETATETAAASFPPVAIAAGFLTAFVSGAIACKWMLGLVRRGKLVWFAAYCALVGTALLVFG